MLKRVGTNGYVRVMCVDVLGVVFSNMSISGLFQKVSLPPPPMFSQAQQQWQHSTHAAAAVRWGVRARVHIPGYAHSTVTPRYGHSLSKRNILATPAHRHSNWAHARERTQKTAAASLFDPIIQPGHICSSNGTRLYCRLLLRRLAADR